MTLPFNPTREAMDRVYAYMYGPEKAARDNARRQIPENVRLPKGYLARRAAPSALQTTTFKMEG